MQNFKEKKKKKRKGINDYNCEIAFEMPVPDYVFSTGKEEEP